MEQDMTSPTDSKGRKRRVYAPATDVLFLKDVARGLGASERTIARRLAAGTFPLKPLQGIDKRPRFSRAQYERFLETGKRVR